MHIHMLRLRCVARGDMLLERFSGKIGKGWRDLITGRAVVAEGA
jgi:hypothetical protein